jgi:hypothetical protein
MLLNVGITDRDRLRRVLSRQYGVISRRQALELGLTEGG